MPVSTSVQPRVETAPGFPADRRLDAAGVAARDLIDFRAMSLG
jgi:hypothetical protein